MYVRLTVHLSVRLSARLSARLSLRLASSVDDDGRQQFFFNEATLF